MQPEINFGTSPIFEFGDDFVDKFATKVYLYFDGPGFACWRGGTSIPVDGRGWYFFHIECDEAIALYGPYSTEKEVQDAHIED